MILNLNKPVGWTSFDVCKKIKVITQEKKVGHAGTLDPFATGVLIVGTGIDTKQLNNISNNNKSYDASILLGSSTDTLDVDGSIIKNKNVPELTEKIIQNVLESFIGDYYQKPPMYSAKKVQGKKLYEYARKNITIERKTVIRRIYSISLNNFTDKNISFSVVCSKGTYIRVLGKEIAEKLGTLGHLDGLIRTKVGQFCIDKSQSIENFEASWKSFSQNKN